MTDTHGRVIWKFPLDPSGFTTISGLVMPTVRMVHADPASSYPFPSIWIEHGPRISDEDIGWDVRICVVGTGHPVPENSDDGMWTHIGSTVCAPLVWHCYQWLDFGPDLDDDEMDELGIGIV